MNTTSAPAPVLRLLAVGNTGLALLEAVGDALPGVEAVAVNTSDAALDAARAAAKISLESPAWTGLGTGGDPEVGRRLAGEHAARIQAACAGADAVLLLAGLGRGAGSGAAPVAAEAARAAGALVIAVVVLPFAFEGARCERQAQRALDRLDEFAHGVIVCPNEDVFQFISQTRPVAEVLREVNGRVADGVAGLCRLLCRRGLLDVNLPELVAVLRDAPARAVLATADGQGTARAAAAVEALLAHPVLKEGRALDGASAVLVGIAAGTELTVAEIRAVMAAINGRCGEAKVFAGAAEDAALGGRLHLTLVAVEAAAPTPLPARPPARMESAPELGGDPLDSSPAPPRSASLFRPPPPELSPDRVRQLAGKRGRLGKGFPRPRQEQLPLQLVSRGRFDSVEPTILGGQDLDVPTYIRRNMVFN